MNAIERFFFSSWDKFIPRLFAGIGVVLLVGAGALTYSKIRFIQETVSVQGTVVARETRITMVDVNKGSESFLNETAEESRRRRNRTPDLRPQDMYYPVVEFNAGGSEPIRFTGDSGSNPFMYELGEAVSLRYRVQDPQDVQVIPFMETWFGASFLAFCALAFMGAGWFIKARMTDPETIRPLPTRTLPTEEQLRRLLEKK